MLIRMFQRLKLTVEYNGEAFGGVSMQSKKSRGVLMPLAEVLQRAFDRFVGEGNAVQLYCSSRTDKGVHAIANVFHVDLRGRTADSRTIDPRSVGGAVNSYLRANEHQALLVSVEAVPSEFHCRFHCVGRTYLYRIICPQEGYGLLFPLSSNKPSEPSDTWTVGGNIGLLSEKEWSWHNPFNLDVTKMIEGAQLLSGTHDFSSFRGKDCAMKSAVRNIEQFEVVATDLDPYAGRHPLRLITITLRARSFLNRQVRNMVGALCSLGNGELTLDELRIILESRDRSRAPLSAPPQGLFLKEVHYPPMDEILEWDGRHKAMLAEGQTIDSEEET